MGIPTLIKTLTASDSASLSFVEGASSVVLDSTYDEYMFVLTDIHNAYDTASFSFQVNAAGQSGFNEAITSTVFRTYHSESDGTPAFDYDDGQDQANGTAGQKLGNNWSNVSDMSGAGILTLFSPASTTYVTHFNSVIHYTYSTDTPAQFFISGYINTTAAIDEIQFKFLTGNFDGVIQMYGIA